MIPVLKLGKLPRPQRLRKIWKIFADAENRLLVPGGNSGAGLEKPEQTEYYCEILESLLLDKDFSEAALEAVKTALAELRRFQRSRFEGSRSFGSETAGNGGGLPRRPLNVMRHLLLAETGRSPADWDLLDAEGKLDPARRRPFPGMTVYLDDIRSPFNVGAMFRTAESFGVEKIFISPLCAAPDHKRAERSAMGCVEIVPWERGDFFAPKTEAALAEETPAFAAKTGVFALETGGVPLEDFPFPRRGIMIAGSEELGVSPRLLAAADSSLGRVTIPSYGVKGSLNVSVAFGIALHAWARSLKSADMSAKN